MIESNYNEELTEQFINLKDEFKDAMSPTSSNRQYQFSLECLSYRAVELLSKYSSDSAVLELGTHDYKHIGEILEQILLSGVLSPLFEEHNDLARVKCDHELWWLLTIVYARHLWQDGRPSLDLYWNPEEPAGNINDRQLHHLRVPMVYYCRFRAKDMDGKWWNSYAPHLFAHEPGTLGRVWDLIVRSSILNSRDSWQLHKLASSYVFDEQRKRVVRGIDQESRVFIRSVHELRVNFAIEKLDLKQADDLLAPMLKMKSDFYSSKRNTRASSPVW